MYPKDKVAIMWRAKSHTWATHNSTFQKGRGKWVQNVYDWVWFPAPQRYKTMVFSTVELELWVYRNKIVESFYCFKRNSYSIPKWSPQANSVHIYLPIIYHMFFCWSILSCSVCKVHSCRITECYSLIKMYMFSIGIQVSELFPPMNMYRIKQVSMTDVLVFVGEKTKLGIAGTYMLFEELAD